VLNPGLYVITDAALGERLLPAVEQALLGGAAVVQYRDKSDDRERRLAEARALAALCRFYQVPLLINDDDDLALAAKADGVHLGRGDGSLREAGASWARTPFWGPPAIIRWPSPPRPPPTARTISPSGPCSPRPSNRRRAAPPPRY